MRIKCERCGDPWEVSLRRGLRIWWRRLTGRSTNPMHDECFVAYLESLI